ncbi:MAG: hypothetical protein QXD48_02525 [Candidatus Aenigmatarchaeota archaeon]
MKKIKFLLIFIVLFLFVKTTSATLICDVVQTCNYTDVLHLSNLSNAHAELPTYSNYNYKLCCYDSIGIQIGTSCSGIYSTLLRLSNETNAHIEKNTEQNYPYNICLNASTGTLTCTYATSCSGYDTCVATISSTEGGSDTNLHIASCNNDPYTTKICCTLWKVLRKVTFSLQLNISGPTNDEAFADNQGAGYYTDLANKFACIQDRTIANEPAFGLAFAGSSFNYLNLTNTSTGYIMKISQSERRNKFVIPITINNCTSVRNKMPLETIIQPFISFVEKISTIQLSVSYPMIDIVGDIQKTGAFKIILEKNETNENQIIIKPV